MLLHPPLILLEFFNNLTMFVLFGLLFSVDDTSGVLETSFVRLWNVSKYFTVLFSVDDTSGVLKTSFVRLWNVSKYFTVLFSVDDTSGGENC